MNFTAAADWKRKPLIIHDNIQIIHDCIYSSFIKYRNAFCSRLPGRWKGCAGTLGSASRRDLLCPPPHSPPGEFSLLVETRPCCKAPTLVYQCTKFIRIHNYTYIHTRTYMDIRIWIYTGYTRSACACNYVSSPTPFGTYTLYLASFPGLKTAWERG